jgi:hypothetical protein
MDPRGQSLSCRDVWVPVLYHSGLAPSMGGLTPSRPARGRSESLPHTGSGKAWLRFPTPRATMPAVGRRPLAIRAGSAAAGLGGLHRRYHCMNPEARARPAIDGLLDAAGWHVQDPGALNLAAGRGVAVHEFPVESGEADYLLFVDRRAAGAVEAKLPADGARASARVSQCGRGTWCARSGGCGD